MTQEFSASNSSPSSTPRKSRNRDKKNPYSDRGLEKFSALLTDLQEKKQKIYSQTGPDNIALLRFAYKDSDECVPVVVKHKSAIVTVKEKLDTKSAATEKKLKTRRPKTTDENNPVRVLDLNRWSKPSYYLTAIVIFVLVLMSEFGRSVTILCTSLVWYLIPVLKESSKSRSPRKKPRNLPEKSIARDGLSDPKYNSSDGMKDDSSRVRRGDRKSW